MATPETLPDKNGTPVAVGDLVITPNAGRVTVTAIVEWASSHGGYRLEYVNQWGRTTTIHPVHVVKFSA